MNTETYSTYVVLIRSRIVLDQDLEILYVGVGYTKMAVSAQKKQC